MVVHLPGLGNLKAWGIRRPGLAYDLAGRSGQSLLSLELCSLWGWGKGSQALWAEPKGWPGTAAPQGQRERVGGSEVWLISEGPCPANSPATLSLRGNL